MPRSSSRLRHLRFTAPENAGSLATHRFDEFEFTLPIAISGSGLPLLQFDDSLLQ